MLLHPPLAGICRIRLISYHLNIVFGKTLNEIVYCAHVPATAEVRLIGTKNGFPDVTQFISVTNPANNGSDERVHHITHTNDSPSKVGVYSRKVEIRDISTQQILFTSDDVIFEFMPDLGCAITIAKSKPGFYLEEINCREVPADGTINFIWEKPDRSLVEESITLPFSIERAFADHYPSSAFYFLQRVLSIGRNNPHKLYYEQAFDFQIPK